MSQVGQGVGIGHAGQVLDQRQHLCIRPQLANFLRQYILYLFSSSCTRHLRREAA